MLKTNIIAFQGTYGANSDIACRAKYPAMQVLPCDSFEATLEAVEKGIADLAMIPIENTLAGRVADIHHLLPQAKLHIIDEYFLPIHFQLMALPNTEYQNIKTVHSHIHALGQCRQILHKNDWHAVVASDTAGAAKWVSEQKDPSHAALAPKLAAELYNLKILATNVEDSPDNITRFVILSKEKKWAKRKSTGDAILTSLLFRVRNVPAALYKALGGFATNGVNMSKLESYQIGGSFQATQFFADIEGHPDDISVQLALEELSFFSAEIRIIGVYPASPWRTAKSKTRS